LEVFDWLFRENRIAAGKFCALGCLVDLRELHCPLFLLAGDRDSIATAGQVLATATLTGASTRDVVTAIAPCGHLALFVGQDTLKNGLGLRVGCPSELLSSANRRVRRDDLGRSNSCLDPRRSRQLPQSETPAMSLSVHDIARDWQPISDTLLRLPGLAPDIITASAAVGGSR
jgi:hypothetical protein